MADCRQTLRETRSREPNKRVMVVEPIVLESAGLRLVFSRREDRYSHTLSLLGPRGSKAVCHSLEGDSASIWPDSPPVQEIHYEQRENRQLVLGTGMSGHSYWSLSCETDPDHGCFRFDIACRIRGTPSRLGSRYQLAADCQLGADGRLVTDEGACRWSSDGRLIWQEGQLQCLPRETEADMTSIRWVYTVMRELAPA